MNDEREALLAEARKAALPLLPAVHRRGDAVLMSEPHGRAALDLVQAAAEAWRGIQAQERAAREAHVDAMRAALDHHPAQDVARVAGCSFQAMYQALERRDGKRRPPKPIKPVPIDA